MRSASAQVEEGRYYLEDHTAQVPLDFSRASLLTDGFVTENGIVLVEGEAVDGVLHVHNMGEPFVVSRFVFGRFANRSNFSARATLKRMGTGMERNVADGRWRMSPLERENSVDLESVAHAGMCRELLLVFVA